MSFKGLFSKGKESPLMKPRSDTNNRAVNLSQAGRSGSEASMSFGSGSSGGFQTLSKSASTSSSSGLNAMTSTGNQVFNTIFVEDPTMNEKFKQNEPPSVPDNPMYRTIWVMKLLHGVITKGGFISPSLYIPKEIWYQYDVDIESLDIKLIAVEACNELLKGLGTKLPTQQEEEAVAKELGSIYAELESIGEKLSARVPCVKMPKVQKDLANKKDKKKDKGSKAGTKMKAIVASLFEKYERKQSQSLDGYRFQLEALLGNSSRILENWLRYTDRMKGDAKELMRKINSFVELALLPFIMEDTASLTNAKLEKIEKTFCTISGK